MSVLVTGASGRIGRRVTERLLADGRSVRALVVPDDPRRCLIERPGVELVEGSLADGASLLEAVDGAEAVIHLAAALTTRNHVDDEYFEINVAGTYRLLSVIRDRGSSVGRFVYISSDAVYWPGGPVPAEYLPVDEEHPRRPGSVYGGSKVAAEELSLAFGRAHGLPVTIVRPERDRRCGGARRRRQRVWGADVRDGGDPRHGELAVGRGGRGSAGGPARA